MANNPIARICRDQAARMRHAIHLMEDGKMWTQGIQSGVKIDTTAETIAEYSRCVIELEDCANRADGTADTK